MFRFQKRHPENSQTSIVSFFYINYKEMFCFQKTGTQKLHISHMFHFFYVKYRQMFHFQNRGTQKMHKPQLFHFFSLNIEKYSVFKTGTKKMHTSDVLKLRHRGCNWQAKLAMCQSFFGPPRGGGC